MNIKRIGPFLILLISFMTIGIWFFVRSGTQTFSDYSVSTHSLGQITGLVGMVLFSLTFILSTRLKAIENIFGGLDKVYFWHHVIGAVSFVLLLFHPVLLVLKFIPSNFPLAAKYLMFSSSFAVNVGIISLLAMILLIALTFYVKMKYQNWKISHKLMGIIFILVSFHIFLVTTDISRYPLLRAYMVVITAIGILSYIYGSFIRPYFLKNKIYIVESVEMINDNISKIEMKPKSKELEFYPGQFAFIKFKGNNISDEQHPFSIASSPTKKNIVMMIKNLGDYTATLHNLKKGSVAEIEGPYGEFGRYDYSKPQVWVAGGIGITPFIGLLEYFEEKKIDPKIDLYYSTKDEHEAFMLGHLKEKAKNLKNLKIITHFSNTQGYLNFDKIKSMSKKSEDQLFLLCGPKPMKDGIIKSIIKDGVNKQDIITEDFGFK